MGWDIYTMDDDSEVFRQLRNMRIWFEVVYLLCQLYTFNVPIINIGMLLDCEMYENELFIVSTLLLLYDDLRWKVDNCAHADPLSKPILIMYIC